MIKLWGCSFGPLPVLDLVPCTEDIMDNLTEHNSSFVFLSVHVTVMSFPELIEIIKTVFASCFIILLFLIVVERRRLLYTFCCY